MPTTTEGKAIAARNAVTHGLFSQEVVLTHLGESADDYQCLCADITRQFSPRSAVQRHYVQQIAQAMWRLRRLLRLEAHLYDDPALTDEDRFHKMARVLRHDNMLRRHIDRALLALSQTPQNCQNEPAPTARDLPASDSTPHPPASGGPCEARGWVGQGAGISASTLRKARQLKQRQKCQNEPAPVSAALGMEPLQTLSGTGRVGGLPPGRGKPV